MRERGFGWPRPWSKAVELDPKADAGIHALYEDSARRFDRMDVGLCGVGTDGREAYTKTSDRKRLRLASTDGEHLDDDQRRQWPRRGCVIVTNTTQTSSGWFVRAGPVGPQSPGTVSWNRCAGTATTQSRLPTTVVRGGRVRAGYHLASCSMVGFKCAAGDEGHPSLRSANDRDRATTPVVHHRAAGQHLVAAWQSRSNITKVKTGHADRHDPRSAALRRSPFFSESRRRSSIEAVTLPLMFRALAQSVPLASTNCSSRRRLTDHATCLASTSDEGACF